ncbi:amidohydrolase family protein [Novosphingobium aquimarinum]|uniref:amidohydrolase family protein n=1 Tax=Novosphingobium aquimarinum TaxID=2682494 RepID=UPI0018DBE7C4
MAVPGLAQAQDYAVTGATVATGDGSAPMENATVVVRGGRIAAVGTGIAVPAGVQAVDGTGMWVTPGLFAAITDLGLYDVLAVDESNDIGAGNSPFNAALDVAPAINPASQDVVVSREGGVTRATVAPDAESSIFAGQGAVIDLGADRNAVTRPRAFQFVELGEYGARRAGGSRTSAHALFRNALREAKAYGTRASIPGQSSSPDPMRSGDDLPIDPRLAGDDRAERGGDVLLTRFDAAALVPVVEGRQPLYVHVERASDILSVLDLSREFPKLDLVIVGASEGWQVANQIAAAGVPVIAQALMDLPVGFEELASTQSNVGRMKQAGVKVAIGPFDGDNHPRYAPQYAGNLVALTKIPGAAGLTWGEALAAITSIPAEIAGMGGRAGVLKPGAVGDVVVWDGDPLEVTSAPVQVVIDGVVQPLDSHQSRLKQRYRDLDESDLPKAYDW